MIVVRPINEDYHKGFEVEGHAEYAEHGADIVCSAVSGIVQFAEMLLKEYSYYGDIDGHVLSDKNRGYLRIETPSSTENMNVVVEQMYDALKQIEKQFPQNIIVRGEI